jgi:hypothetical protein
MKQFALHDQDRDRSLTFSDIFNFLTLNGEKICIDPRGDFESSDSEQNDMDEILSKLYYFLDSNHSG